MKNFLINQRRKTITTLLLWKNNIHPKQRSGKPRKPSPKQRSTRFELANILNKHYSNLNISNRTVLNELYRLQYRSTVPKSMPLLTNQHKQCLLYIENILTVNLFDNANNIMGTCWILQQDNDPKECFREIIHKEWKGIDKKFFVNLIHSMPSRLNEIIEKNDDDDNNNNVVS
ncbi:14218_t:CDS:2 [Entrophospora sp. SA101]|nr:14218_t:CDS:2 [Entrophospora sp. SA101]